MMNNQFSPHAAATNKPFSPYLAATDTPFSPHAATDMPPAQPAGPESPVRRHKGRQPRDKRFRPIPLTIVGGGIGGLSVALSLLDAGAVGGEDITIVDASPGSGRLHTYTGRLGHVCELGAGRYSPSLHPRLDALVTRFGSISRRTSSPSSTPRARRRPMSSRRST